MTDRAAPRVPTWVRAFIFWTLLVVLFTARTDLVDGEPLPRAQAFAKWASFWYLWALVVPLVAWVDARLPVEREALIRRLAFHIPLSVGVTVAHAAAMRALAELIGFPLDRTIVEGSVLTAVTQPTYLVYWAIVSALVVLEYQRHVRERELRTMELERLLTESRLDTLKTQLHPHFLFNALNAISASVESEPQTARWMLEELGTLLRSSLEHAREQEIPLDRELEFTHSYLALQKVRYDDRLEAVTHVAPDARDALVPTLLLQPLIENAIRHGIATRSSGGRIEIAIRREADALRLQVTDNGPGLPPGWDVERDLGIGLSNTRERLKQLYGTHQTFAIFNRPEGGACVDISLPYRPSVAGDAEAEVVEMGPGTGTWREPALTMAGATSARARSGRHGS
ncbi:MAG TPA: histidine kinase [Vicinamibacterales bacterium]